MTGVAAVVSLFRVIPEMRLAGCGGIRGVVE